MNTNSLPTLQQPPTGRLLPGLLRLTGEGLVRMWRMLGAIWVGLVCVIVLVCAGPLFSQVAITADLQSLATGVPDGAYFTVEATDPDSLQAQAIQNHVNSLLHHGALAPYVGGEPQVIVRTPPFLISAKNLATPVSLVLDGYGSVAAAQHVVVLQGRLPRVSVNGNIEIALAPDTANALRVHVGSTVLGNLANLMTGGSTTWTLHVVGLISPQTPSDPFWLTCPDCSNAGIQFASPFSPPADAGQTTFTALAAADFVLARQRDLRIGEIQDENMFTVFWRYSVNFSRAGAADAFALAQQVSDIDDDLAVWRGPDGIQATMTGTLDSLLRHYWGLIVQLDAALAALEVAIVVLALFLLNLMVQTLIERQLTLIVTLRKRGATRLHVASMLAAQGLVVLIAAMALGPLLAVALSSVLARTLLPASAHGALAEIASAPMQAALSVQGYADIVVVCGLVLFVWAAMRSASITMVQLRRHDARTSEDPAWRRLFLDVIAAVFALGIYLLYVVSWTQSATAPSLSSQRYVVLTNLGLLVAPLPYVAALLFFLRVLPWLFRFATYCAARLSTAGPLVACAQLERAGRPAVRLIVLLALAISTGSFFATLLGSMQQHAQDVAAFYAEGADVTAPLPASVAGQSFGQLQTYFKQWPGVQSATLGYQRVVQLDAANPINMPAFGEGTLTIDAVDTNTFTQTARWSTMYSAQPLATLMSALAQHRSEGIRRHVVYAFADAAACERYTLKPEATLQLPANDASTAFISYSILGCIRLIPGVYDAAAVHWTGIGLLADYQDFVAVYAGVVGEPAATMVPNYVWLRTNGLARVDAAVQAALPAARDRRTITALVQQDAFFLDVVGILVIGIGVALLLVLLGALLTSWLTTANRSLSLTIMSTLGMSRRELMVMALYEQGLIYGFAALLGGILWLLLLPFVAPTIAFFTVERGHQWDNNFNIPPVQTVVPVSGLAILVTLLAGIAATAVLLPTWQRSHSAGTLSSRLGED